MFGADDRTALRTDSGESNADGGARSVVGADSVGGADSLDRTDSLVGVDSIDRGRSQGEGG